MAKGRKPTRAALRKKCEKLCRQIVGDRDDWRCQWCRKSYSLQYSHIVPRSQSTRLAWDPINGMMKCAGCHIKWHHASPCEGGNWFIANWPERWEYLQWQKKIKEPLRIIFWQQLLDRLEQWGE